MKLHNIIYLIAIALCTTSCGMLTKDKGFSVGKVSLEMSMNDLKCVGETEISVEYHTYLGLIKQIDKVNGETYLPGNKKMLSIPQPGLNFEDKGMKLAAYKLVEQYPDAVYFQILYESQVSDRLFLGSTNKKTAKVRAYKLK